MKTVKPRKPRGIKQDGTPSQDLCPHCYSFGCDPMSMSIKFDEKIRNRLRKGLCPSCGNPKEFCSCKSSRKGVRITTHNNKKMRQAQAKIAEKEQAYKAWLSLEDTIADLIGDDKFSDISYDLHHHRIPDIPLEDVRKMAPDVDFSDVEAGWK